MPLGPKCLQMIKGKTKLHFRIFSEVTGIVSHFKVLVAPPSVCSSVVFGNKWEAGERVGVEEERMCRFPELRGCGVRE